MLKKIRGVNYKIKEVVELEVSVQNTTHRNTRGVRRGKWGAGSCTPE
jgi:hypothetical protein